MELLKMANLTNKKRTDTQNEVTKRLNNQARLLQKMNKEQCKMLSFGFFLSSKNTF